MKSRIFTILQIFCRIFIAGGNAARTVSSIWTTVGDRVILPCPISPSIPGDRTVLILWFRDSNTESVYSYDARKEDFSSGMRWSDKDVFGPRAFFTVTSSPPALIIDPVNRDDQGQYVCRVEYQRSPSTFIRVNLSVIIPPEPPLILWKGREVMGTVGPLNVGEKVRLTCQTKGGRPTPLVTWWKEGLQMNSITEAKVVTGETVVQSTTEIVAGRDVNNVPLYCHAQAPYPGQALSQPRSVSSLLDVLLPPVSIKITGLDNPLVAGTTVQPMCLSFGSNPLAEIKWFKGGQEIKETTKSVMNRGNITSSTISIHVTLFDHEKFIRCMAFNPSLKDGDRQDMTVSDSVKLEVIYPPKAELYLGEVLDASNLIEGEDAYLECSVEANPPPHRIQWFHNGRPIDNENGIVVSGASLAMQKMKREHSGSYRCSADNLEGKSFSNFLEVKIKHAPVCASDKDRTQGVALGNPAKVLCRVEADPADNLTFSWSRILPSGREMQLPDSAAQLHAAHSYLTMTPRHLGDFGLYLCRAKNKIGTQKKPCRVTVVSAGPPEAPNNCTAIPGSESLSINCKEGFHGGFPQKFRLEAWRKGLLIANITREFPAWTVDDLEDGAEIKIEVKALNVRGISDAFSFDAHMPIAHQQSVTIPEISEDHFGPLLGAVLGILAVLIILFVVVIVTAFRRWRRCRRKPATDDDSTDVLRSPAGGDVSPDVVSSIQSRVSSNAYISAVNPQENASTTNRLVAVSSSRFSSDDRTDDQSPYLSDCRDFRSKAYHIPSSQSPLLSPLPSPSTNSQSHSCAYSAINSLPKNPIYKIDSCPSERTKYTHHNGIPLNHGNVLQAVPNEAIPNSGSRLISGSNHYLSDFDQPTRNHHRDPGEALSDHRLEDRHSSYENLDEDDHDTIIFQLEKSPSVRNKYTPHEGKRSQSTYSSQPKNEICLKVDVTSQSSIEDVDVSSSKPKKNYSSQKSNIFKIFTNNKKKCKTKDQMFRDEAKCVKGIDGHCVASKKLLTDSPQSPDCRESTV